MPKIEQQVKQEITPAVNVGAGLTNPEIPQTMQQRIPDFKTGMEKTNAVAEALINKEIQRIDNAVGMENGLKLGSATDTIEKQMQQYKGKDASKAAMESDRLWAEETKKIYDDNVHTRAQDEAFQRAYAQNTLKLKANVGSYIARETDAYVNETYKATIASNADMGGKNPNLLEAKLKENEQVSRDFAKLNGKSDEWTKNEILTNNSILVDNSIKNYLNNDDPNGALAVYNIYQNYIPEEKRLAMGKKLNEFVNQNAAIAIATEVYDPKVPMDEILKRADAKTGNNTILRKETHDQISAMGIATEKGKKTTEENAFAPVLNAASALLQQGIPPSQGNINSVLLKTAQEANPTRYYQMVDHWNIQARAAKTDKETMDEQNKNYLTMSDTIMHRREGYRDINPIQEFTEQAISYKQANSLLKMQEKYDPAKAAQVAYVKERLDAVFKADLQRAKSNPEKFAEIEKDWNNYKNILANFVENNFTNADDPDFTKKMDAFVDTVIKPAEANAIGRLINSINPFAGDYKEITQKEKEAAIKAAVGEKRKIPERLKTTKPPVGSGAKLAPDGYYYKKDKATGKYMRWE